MPNSWVGKLLRYNPLSPEGGRGLGRGGVKPATIFLVSLVILLAVLQYKLWVSPEGVPQFWKLKHSIQQVHKENAVLQERNAWVVREVKELKHGMDGVEERARDDFGLTKQGEVFYQIVE